jgi:hypothetical protein
MPKRLQVILQDADYRAIRRMAQNRHMTIAEWVRQALAVARRREPLGDVTKKVAVIRAAAKNNFPTADIDRMLAEIERGYLSGTKR